MSLAIFVPELSNLPSYIGNLSVFATLSIPYCVEEWTSPVITRTWMSDRQSDECRQCLWVCSHPTGSGRQVRIWSVGRFLGPTVGL